MVMVPGLKIPVCAGSCGDTPELEAGVDNFDCGREKKTKTDTGLMASDFLLTVLSSGGQWIALSHG